MKMIINEYGKPLFSISGNEETIKLNTPKGGDAVDMPPHENMYYSGGVWIPISNSPNPAYSFNYITKDWEDTRTVDQVRSSKWNEIKNLRDSLEYSGFSFEGNEYDSDVKSQSRIIAASNLGSSVEWTTKDNAIVLLSVTQLVGLREALANHVTQLHDRGRKARELIYSLDTIDKIEQVVL